MQDKVQKMTPEIRFKGYTDAWVLRKLGEIVNITMGQSPSSINYTDDSSDNILVQGNADLKNGWVVPRVWTKQITKKGKKGDIILSVRAPVGEVAKSNFDVVLGRGVASITGNEFVYQTLLRLKTNGYWKRLSTGSTFESINTNDIKNANLFFTDKSEQQAIGSLFKKLDDLIALQQRKSNIQKVLKKAILQRIFPENEKNVPRIRFANFTEKWVQRKLGDLAPLCGGFSFKSTDFINNGIALVRISNISTSGLVSGNFVHVKELDNDGKVNLYDGSILIAMSGATTGKIAIIKNIGNKKMYQNQRVGYFQKTKTSAYQFIAILVRTEQFLKQLNTVLISGAQPNVSSKDIDKFKFYVPSSIDEQQLCGLFFDNLDKSLNTVNQKVLRLKCLKKAMLKKLFI